MKLSELKLLDLVAFRTSQLLRFPSTQAVSFTCLFMNPPGTDDGNKSLLGIKVNDWQPLKAIAVRFG